MSGERLAAARGAVRDGVAAVESFAQLLGSRRVGPRGIVRALPEVKEGCETLRAALADLSEALAEQLGGDVDAVDAARAVIAHASAEVARLEAELDGGDDPARKGGRTKAPPERTIDARQRLALEGQVRRASRELEGALLLLELLAASIDLRPTPLNLTDVLRERSSAVVRALSATRVAVDCDDDCDNIDVDPRVMGGLLEIAVGMLGHTGVANPRISANRREDGRVAVVIGPQRGAAPPGRVELDLPLRDGGPRSRAVASAVARRAGVELAFPGTDEDAITLVA